MELGTPPKVSVIIPCYNLGLYLDEAVESVLAQTIQDFEIVIVNDGSTDAETNRLLVDYRRPKTRIVQSDNRGLGSARNLAIDHSLGSYLCALDADDKLAPTFLEKSTRILDCDEGIAFVSCWLRTFGTEDWIWKPDRCDLPTLLGECTVATPALVRRAAVREIGGYDQRMPIQGYEDWDLWISLVERGFRGVIIPEVLFYYRRRPGSMSETCCRGEAHLDLMRYLMAKHDASYREHLVELLIQKEAVTCELLKTTYALDREIDSWLLTIERRREELSRLQQRLQAIQQREQEETRLAELQREVADSRRHVEELRAAVAHAENHVLALRRSISWRVTAPLRAAYDLVHRFLGSGRASSTGAAADLRARPPGRQGSTLP